ncbi:hypothetical protein CYLTODRAFT_480913 [Cylindrobasidium torrendii FP15055 ss-10]|uniref:Uncharacterized protein n=1 Tax=Cylindrobasidium torrendii FP15055 ss-10 TaxID=1314674 RepID=A0A0D7ASN2_9AGAR|nr:hypothetical protein CYLTODRAFT_480913 [Cylindrobasidium torrendii FP15055 ss-10]
MVKTRVFATYCPVCPWPRTLSSNRQSEISQREIHLRNYHCGRYDFVVSGSGGQESKSLLPSPAALPSLHSVEFVALRDFNFANSEGKEKRISCPFSCGVVNPSASTLSSHIRKVHHTKVSISYDKKDLEISLEELEALLSPAASDMSGSTSSRDSSPERDRDSSPEQDSLPEQDIELSPRHRPLDHPPLEDVEAPTSGNRLSTEQQDVEMEPSTSLKLPAEDVEMAPPGLEEEVEYEAFTPTGAVCAAEAVPEPLQKKRRLHSPDLAPSQPVDSIQVESNLIKIVLKQMYELKWLGTPLCNSGCSLDKALASLRQIRQNIPTSTPMMSLSAYRDLANLSTVLGQLANHLFYESRKIHSIKLSVTWSILEDLCPLLRAAKLHWPTEDDLVVEYIAYLRGCWISRFHRPADIDELIAGFAPGHSLSKKCMGVFARAWTVMGAKPQIVICPPTIFGTAKVLASEMGNKLLHVNSRFVVPMERYGCWVLLVADRKEMAVAVVDVCCISKQEDWDSVIRDVQITLQPYWNELQDLSEIWFPYPKFPKVLEREDVSMNALPVARAGLLENPVKKRKAMMVCLLPEVKMWIRYMKNMKSVHVSRTEDNKFGIGDIVVREEGWCLPAAIGPLIRYVPAKRSNKHNSSASCEKHDEEMWEQNCATVALKEAAKMCKNAVRVGEEQEDDIQRGGEIQAATIIEARERAQRLRQIFDLALNKHNIHFAIVGSSGAGKSSLINAIRRLEPAHPIHWPRPHGWTTVCSCRPQDAVSRTPWTMTVTHAIWARSKSIA